MKVNNAKYEVTAVHPNQYPESILKEVAFIGRSNVGKSSLINFMLNRKNLARVACKPGKTRVINFYNIDQKLYFVDLPGYGYAEVSKDKKATWGEMIEVYLNTRRQLVLLIMLVDIRHSPSKDDKLMYDWLISKGINHQIVATKADKIPRAKIKEKITDIKKTLGMEMNSEVIIFSNMSKLGRDELWAVIDSNVESINE